MTGTLPNKDWTKQLVVPVERLSEEETCLENSSVRKHWPNMYFNRCKVQKTDYVMIITDRGRKLDFV